MRKEGWKRRGDVGSVLRALQAVEPAERNSRTPHDELEECDTLLMAKDRTARKK